MAKHHSRATRKATGNGAADFVPHPDDPIPARPPEIIAVEACYYASIKVTLSDGSVLQFVAAGNSTNAENAKARDRLVAVLKGGLNGR